MEHERRADDARHNISVETHIAVVSAAQKLRDEHQRALGRAEILQAVAAKSAPEEVRAAHLAVGRLDIAVKTLVALLAEYGTNPIGGAW
jgi:hypothetical protein